jgi:hypothetical protein
MSKIINQNGYVENGQFAGGLPVTGSDPINSNPLPFIAGGLYLGQTGNLVAQTIDGSVLTFVSASGFIPGIFTAISSSTTAGAIIALK